MTRLEGDITRADLNPKWCLVVFRRPAPLPRLASIWMRIAFRNVSSVDGRWPSAQPEFQLFGISCVSCVVSSPSRHECDLVAPSRT